MAALTIDDLQKVYGVTLTDKAMLQAYLDTAEAACLMRAELEEGTVDEWYDGGSPILALTHAPVQEIKSVDVAGYPAVYRFDQRASKIVLKEVPPEGKDLIKVTYTTGWRDGRAPAQVRSAIALTVRHLIKINSDDMIGVLSRSTDGGTEQIEQSVLPIAVKGLLDGYRKGVI